MHLSQRPEDTWSLFVDGSANKLQSGAGILLVAPGGEKFMRALRFKFPASNNQAEYEALIAGMELARDMDIKHLEIRSDSQLIVNQIKGEYDTINPVLAKYCQVAREILKFFEYHELRQIMRAENLEADLLPRITEQEIVNLKKECQIEFMETPVIDRVQISLIEEHEKDWVDEIKDYIEMQILPTDRENERFIQKVAAKYTVIKEVLFRRSYSQAFLRCVKAHLITRTLYEVHEGVCGGHPAARTLSDKI